jgi:hypothetical protein
LIRRSTISLHASGVIAETTGAFVAPLVLAVAIMLAAATTVIPFLPHRAVDATGKTSNWLPAAH